MIDLLKLRRLIDRKRTDPNFKEPEISIFNIIVSFCNNLRQAEEILDKFGNYFSEGSIDELLYNKNTELFLNHSINNINPKSILVPWLYNPYIALLLDKYFKKTKKHLITPNHQSKKLLEFFKTNSKVEVGEPLEILKSESNNYDLIISSLPLNKKTKISNEINDYGHEIILDSSRLLKKDGFIIFFTTDKFFYDNSPHSLKQNLIKHNLKIHSVTTIPLDFDTSIKTNLVVIKKGPQNKIICAKLGNTNEEIENTAKIITSNFNNEYKVDNIFLEDIEHLLPSEKLSQKSELNDLLDKTGFKIVKLGDLTTKKPEIVKRGAEKYSINTIYMPRIGLGNTFLDLDDESSKAKNVYKIQLDSDQVNSHYLVRYFNSYIGKMAREYLMTGSAIPNINLSSIEDIQIALPEIEIQNGIIEQDSNINVAIEKLKSIQDRLWTYPAGYQNHKKNIDKILKDKNSNDWIEYLPFPLSSIIWGYYSESTIERKIDYLLLFFEALSEFNGIIFISALTGDKEFYENEYKKWLKGNLYKDWLERSTFGSWNKLIELSSAKLRKYYNNNSKDESDNKEYINGLFGDVTNSFIEFITDKKLLNNLSYALEKRNSIKHSSIKSKKEQKKDLNYLENILSEIKNILIRGFSDVELFDPIPRTSDKQDFWICTARLLKGSRSKFQQVELKSHYHLESNNLYFKGENSYKPLKLLPFILMRESPKYEQNACYFYNRREKDQAKYVSYHFQNEAEILEGFEPLKNTFQILSDL